MQLKRDFFKLPDSDFINLEFFEFATTVLDNSRSQDKAKPVGRKATALNKKTAGLPWKLR
ncbi:Uncharacterized protein dnm_080770 [Desulfonema magnum]|uniref:Uncharacterized protein n=1 Tax=Desulfonema magnum TaxID=45655 RepID=A0A975BVJ2_9BACT|nr:Uncharacterized protein dnm_080770 [Desulfonema magnum]